MLKKIFFPLTAVVLSTAVSFLFLEIAVRISGRVLDEGRYWDKRIEEKIKKIKKLEDRIIFDHYLGWDNNFGTGKNTGGIIYRNNRQRLRAGREYALQSKPGTLRAVFVGDSFTYGEGVNIEDSWLTFLDEKLGDKVEIINMGVPGYGSDQAFLKLKRQGIGFYPRVAVLVIYLENIFRNVNIYRPFYFRDTGIPLSKPRFTIKENNELEIVNSPVIPLDKLKKTILHFSNFQLKKYEFFYRSGYFSRFHLVRYVSLRLRNRRNTYEYALKPGAEPFEITLAIADNFNRYCLNHNINPYIIIFPTVKQLFDYPENTCLQKFLKELNKRKIKHLDVTPDFNKQKKQYTKEDLYKDHFTKLASRIIAGIVYDYFVKEKTFQ